MKLLVLLLKAIRGVRMNALNSIILEGNIVREPELQTTATDTAVYQFPIAVNRWYRTQDNQVEKEVSFFRITASGQLGKRVYEKSHKKQGVRVVGRLKQERWSDNDGKKCSKVVIVAEHVEFCTVAKTDGTVPQNIEESAGNLSIGGHNENSSN
jgi:single-strand DNA-binding protein